MVALQANRIVAIPLEEACQRKTVPVELYNVAKGFFA
jgi:hypothetical protein